jgi:hypothetical protein
MSIPRQRTPFYKPTDDQTESRYGDAVTGGTHNHQMNAVEAQGDRRSRVLLTCPTRCRDEILQRGLSLLPATGLKPAILKKGA